MDVVDCFARTYAEARQKFLAAARDAGAAVESIRHPRLGPAGEELATDLALLGNADADKLLIAGSGTHGVEGFCGSGAQVAMLRSGIPDELGEDVALLLVHAQNPHGFANERRVTEDNVDYNRNFIDFDAPLPENPDYDALHPHLVPTAWEGPAREAADAGLKCFVDEKGAWAFQAALSLGQYNHPDGLYFGGTGPTWSRRTLETIVADYDLAARKLVAVIDYHTGLGPFGYGELISAHTVGSENVERAKRWYGLSVTQPDLGTSASVPKTGLGEIGWERLLGERVSCIAIEYGTFTPEEGRVALRADHWLHKHRNVDWTAAETREIKIGLKRHFYPETADWQEMVLLRSRMVVRQALEALARER